MGVVSEVIDFNRLENIILVAYVCVIKAAPIKQLTFLSNASSFLYPEEQKVAELAGMPFYRHRQMGDVAPPQGIVFRPESPRLWAFFSDKQT